MTLTHSPEKENFESLWVGTHDYGLDFFSKKDAYSFPEIHFLKIFLDFFSKNDAYSFPAFWIFFPRFTYKG